MTHSDGIASWEDTQNNDIKKKKIEENKLNIQYDIYPVVDIIWASGWKPRICVSKRILNPWFPVMAHIMSVDQTVFTTGIRQDCFRTFSFPSYDWLGLPDRKLR